MAAASVRCARPEGRPHTLVITIDRPPVNAMTLAAYRELLAALQSLDSEPDIRCAILTGGGERAFVAGSDVNELGALDPSSALERARLARKVFDGIRSAPVPVVAAVRGYALGAGLVMVAQADIIVASENASFGLPEINVGVMGGTKHLARIVPEKVMRWMALTGNRVDAAYLERLGVIQKVVPMAEVLETALSIADDICRKSPAGMRLMKEVINLTEPMELNAGYHVETFATSIISSHPQSKEAARAFIEKRAPVY